MARSVYTYHWVRSSRVYAGSLPITSSDSKRSPARSSLSFVIRRRPAVGYTAYEETQQQIYLSKLYLHQSTRGKGYASQVFDWYEEITSGKTLHLNVNKQNQQAIAVYEHRGFRVSERTVAIGSGVCDG